MNNPLTILRTLDSFLRKETRVVLYGRAALALGYPGGDPSLGATKDVDVILPSVDMASIESDDQFWEALERTNAKLEPQGLYITHLFTDEQIVLTRDWRQNLASIDAVPFEHLRAFRPSTLDLVLTKMMRDDPQDADDIGFLLRQESVAPSELAAAFARARCPDVAEIRETFERLKPKVLRMAESIAREGQGK